MVAGLPPFPFLQVGLCRVPSQSFSSADPKLNLEDGGEYAKGYSTKGKEAREETERADGSDHTNHGISHNEPTGVESRTWGRTNAVIIG